jgi:hypothetical protein
MNENLQSLVVEAGEYLTLSPDSGRFKAVVKQHRPQTIDEVRKILGPSLQKNDSTMNYNCCVPAGLKSTVVLPEDLTSKDKETKNKANRLTFAAARYYVQAVNNSGLFHWIPTLNIFIQKNKALLNIFEFGNIDVYNGATLNISKNSQAIYADAIRLHGSGKIVCNGPTTFRSTSFEGKISSFLIDNVLNSPIISSLTT